MQEGRDTSTNLLKCQGFESCAQADPHTIGWWKVSNVDMLHPEHIRTDEDCYLEYLTLLYATFRIEITVLPPKKTNIYHLQLNS